MFATTITALATASAIQPCPIRSRDVYDHSLDVMSVARLSHVRRTATMCALFYNMLELGAEPNGY
jgi:hypothetical protein